jgi:hypothetical protein
MKHLQNPGAAVLLAEASPCRTVGSRISQVLHPGYEPCVWPLLAEKD